ncbi:DUF1702 family protein [Nocardia sp. NPDC051321]|uniref:DUF1702 family protein n=1 Tax=Nocardia sp. NPDC051321 TaxID=3364323 RepID=UPI0037AEA15D
MASSPTDHTDIDLQKGKATAMAPTLSTVLQPILKLSADKFPELAAQRFGAQEDMDRTWQAFEPVARTLVDTFYFTLDNPGHDRLVPELDAVDEELRGIAYEGAGMGLMLLDTLLPYKKRLPQFVHGPAAPYRCLVYIGAGLVLPRVPTNPHRFLARQDPFLRWLVMDGYGFYAGFFSWQHTVEQQRIPARLRGYARRGFDQGLGRSLWFSTGANVARIIDTIDVFPQERRGDLWSGIGLACAYAAGVLDREAIGVLVDASARYRPHLAAGAAVASVFRAQSGLTAPHTDLACDVIWATDASEVARMALDLAEDLPRDKTEPAYELWRDQIRRVWLRDSTAITTGQELDA